MSSGIRVLIICVIVEIEMYVIEPMNCDPLNLCTDGRVHCRDLLKGALYRIWCGVNRLGDSCVKVV